EFREIYKQTATPAGEKYDLSQEQVGRRELHNTSLSFLGKLATPEMAAKAFDQYQHATNMTEKLSALSTLSKIPRLVAMEARSYARNHFYKTYKDNNNVIDKWLQISAAVPDENPLLRVQSLMKHPSYDETNPNKVYALMGGFMGGNPGAFHNKDG